MKYTLHENLSDKKGVISNTHGFLDRKLDTSFDAKWSGYWVPPIKFLDYFSFRINGIWLDKSSLEAVEYGDKIIYHHETDSMIIHEEVITPESFPGFKINLKMENKTPDLKAIRTTLETGIDIRPKDEDIGSKNYNVEPDNNRVLVTKDNYKISIESEDITGFEGERYTKEHYPGEKQVCLVPERPVFQKEIEGNQQETISIDFKTSQPSFYEIDSNENELEHSLGRSFGSSIDSLENLIYNRQGLGIIAGHPWFQSYWARDSFWSILGLIDAGYFEISEKILENYVESGLPGKIDLENGMDDEIVRDDTYPLFIIVSEKLKNFYGLSEKIKEGRSAAMDKLELENNIAQHTPCGTWMDTIERSEAIDIQSLWLEAAKIMEDDRLNELEKGLDLFIEEQGLRDELGKSHQTVNTTIPLMFDQVSDETAEIELEKINGEFCSRYGARTRSVTDPGYQSDGYHTGSVWGLTTCWAAAANFKHGKDREGCNFLEKLDQFLDRNQPGALPEVVDAESGELLGTPEQAWSAGLLVHVIDSYMLGITADDEGVNINPADNLNCVRKGKIIKGERLDIKISNGNVNVLNDPDLNLRL